MATPATTATSMPGPSPWLRLGDTFRKHRWLVLTTLLLVGAVVFLPAARAQLTLDDYLHASMIDGTFPGKRSPFDLYNFVADGERSLMFERGMLPWWSHPQLRIRFLRPLPSVLRWSEQHVFGRNPVLPHVHSMIWWMLVVLAGRRLFRRVLEPRPALFATIVFAMAPAHALPIAWLANREALISLTLGALALTEYLRWREEGTARSALVAFLLFAVSMAGGEYALCFGGYVLALELVARDRPLPRRILGLALYGAPVAAYLAVRAAIGCGTRGSGFYLDPLHEPLAFLRIAPSRLAALLAQQWLTLDGDTVHDTSSPWLLGSIVALGLVFLWVPLSRTFASLEPRRRELVIGLFVGGQLSLIPVLAVDPSPRVLGAAVLGVSPAVAQLLELAWFPATAPERRGAAELTGLAALAVGFAQLVHGPVTAYLIGEHYRQISEEFVKHVAELRAHVPDVAHTNLMILRGFNSSFFMPFALSDDGAAPARWRVLATTGHVLVLRKDEHTLELVAPKDQSMFTWDLFRDTNAKVRVGEVFDTPGLRATVLEVNDEGPRRVRFELDRGLDASGLVWISENGKGEFPLATLPRLGFGQPYEP